jgi:hypothetical protein
MATKGEKYRRLCEFLEGSFRREELARFLTLNEYEELVRAVNSDTSIAQYFFEVVKALDQRNLIKDQFFDRLAEERPEKKQQIQEISEFWRDQSAEPIISPPSREVVNSIGMRLKLIPAGEFIMGSPDSDSAAQSNEKPTHPVTISQAFYLGTYPVTQDEYLYVAMIDPSQFDYAEHRPVESVSWFDAVEFCNALQPKKRACRRSTRSRAGVFGPSGRGSRQGRVRLPAADRGGVGIRLSSWKQDSVLFRG